MNAERLDAILQANASHFSSRDDAATSEAAATPPSTQAPPQAADPQAADPEIVPVVGFQLDRERRLYEKMGDSLERKHLRATMGETANPAKIRKSPRQGHVGGPGRKSTRAEVDRLVANVAEMLGRRWHMWQIKKYLREKHNIGYRQAQEYVSRARSYLIEQVVKDDPRDLIAAGVEVYQSVLRDPAASRGERMQAQRELNIMLGLNMPIKIAPTDPTGEHEYGAAQIEAAIKEMSDAELEHLAAASARLRELADANKTTQN